MIALFCVIYSTSELADIVYLCISSNDGLAMSLVVRGCRSLNIFLRQNSIIQLQLYPNNNRLLLYYMFMWRDDRCR